MSRRPTAKSSVKEVERHPLGYDINAPLPYFLDDETLFGHYEVKNPDWAEGNPFIETEHVLADFLNSSARFYNPKNTRDPFAIPAIDETIFVQRYLPHFYKAHYTTEEENPVMLAWVHDVSTSLYAPVNVIREGRIIYRVPPAINKLNTLRANERRVSPTIMGIRMEQEINRLPNLKDVKTREVLGTLFERRDGTEAREMNIVELKCLFTMDEIFTYYGYESILTPEIMSIKSQILGTEHTHGHAVRSVSPTSTTRQVDPTYEEDDSDLFG